VEPRILVEPRPTRVHSTPSPYIPSCWKTDISGSVSTLSFLLNKFATNPQSFGKLAALFTECRPTTGVKPNKHHQDRRRCAPSLVRCRCSSTCHRTQDTIPCADRVSVWRYSGPGMSSASTVALSPLVKAWPLPNASRRLHTLAASAGTLDRSSLTLNEMV
jgi:hypothetical protein